MVVKNEPSRCSLDEFLENNTQEIRIHSPEEIFFVREGKRISLTRGEDLTLLKDFGFILESPFMKKDENLSKGFGWAYLLDPEGRRTGYQLINHGAEEKDKYIGWHHIGWYQLEPDEETKKTRIL